MPILRVRAPTSCASTRCKDEPRHAVDLEQAGATLCVGARPRGPRDHATCGSPCRRGAHRHGAGRDAGAGAVAATRARDGHRHRHERAGDVRHGDARGAHRHARGTRALAGQVGHRGLAHDRGARRARSRGARAQADFSLRGASFGQVLVLVDGVRLNNSQTGHHNGDLPVPFESIERIEVLLGAGTSLYGADAVGGTINIVTRQGTLPWSARLGVGQHALVEGSADGSITRGRWTQQVSLGGLRTDGFMFDRDEAVITARTRASFGTTSSIGASIADKAFGANGFYGNSPSKEWTQAGRARRCARAAGARRHAGDGAGRVPDASGSLPVGHQAPGIRREQAPHARGHGRDRPGGAGGSALERGIQVERTRDWIRSSNLGDHAHARGGAYVDAQGALARARTPSWDFASIGTHVRPAWAPSMGVGAWVTVREAPRCREPMRSACRRSPSATTATRHTSPTADLDPERHGPQTWPSTGCRTAVGGDGALSRVPRAFRTSSTG